MDLNTYFDKIICINLDRRKDRWDHSLKQFRKIGLNVKRYSAIDGNPMEWNHVRNKNNPFYVYNFCGFYFGDGYMNGKKNKHYNPTIREAFKRNKPNEEGCEKIKKRYETTLQFINTVTELMAKY